MDPIPPRRAFRWIVAAALALVLAGFALAVLVQAAIQAVAR